MANITKLVETILQKISNVTSNQDRAQLFSIIKTLDISSIKFCNTYSDLPSAANNIRVAYLVLRERTIFWSNGTTWSSFSFATSQIISFGLNSSGQLGDGTTIDKSSPVSLIPQWRWNQIAAGESHTAALKFDNTIWTYGLNSYGRLGNGFTTARSSPVSLIAPANSWTWLSVSSGFDHTVAINTDGTIWSWGRSFFGGLGNGFTTARSSPVSLIAPANSWTWTQVDAGDAGTVAIKPDGTIWSWGWNSYGKLGDGTTINKSSPVSLVAPANSWTWKQVSCQQRSTAAIRSDDTLWTWSWNTYGQLGDGTSINASSPVSLIAPANSWTWKQVSASSIAMAAIKSDNTLWTWGYNTSGTLGNGFTISKSSPVSVLGGFTWNYVSVGYSTMLAIRSDNTLWTWGRNNEGQLGDGTTIDKSSPISLISPVNNYVWKQVEIGRKSSVAILVNYK